MADKKLDILAFGAHPDDVELSSAGTLLAHKQMGYTFGLVDLTRGELGTRGSAEIRDQEAAAAAKILGADVRVNLAFADGFFSNDKEHQLEVMKVIRRFKPDVVLANAITDRHPDHGMGAQLLIRSCFLAGLPKIETEYDGQSQEAWRPKNLYHYIQSDYIDPDLVVDITPHFEQKMEAVKAYSSQFFSGKHDHDDEPDTFISSPEFLDLLSSRAIDFGKAIGVRYAEGFTSSRFLGVKEIMKLS